MKKLLPLLIACFVVLVFLPVRNFEFLNFDDGDYVFANRFVTAGLTIDGLRWAFTEAHAGHWHPLTWLSHMLDVELFGLDPGAHHLVNVALHAASAALLFLLLQRFGIFSIAAAIVVTLLFAVHPQRLESVAWVAERKDVLSMFFTLCSFHGYLWFVRSTKHRAIPYLATLIALVLALLAKPSAVVVPILFLLADFWPLRRVSAGWTKLVLEKLPFFIAVAGCCIAAILAQGDGGGLKSLTDFPAMARVSTVLVGYSIYFGKFFFPTGQGIFYPYQLYQPGVASGAFALLLIVSGLCVANLKQRPYLAFGWLWFIVALLPVIGIVQVGGQSYADRWSYLPSIGLLIGVTAMVVEVLTRKTALIVGVASVAIATTLTVTQIDNWRSSEAIFRHTAKVAPENFMAEMNLGVALRAQGRNQEALGHFQNAVLLRPFYPEALTNLAIVTAETGNFPEAEALFRRALSANPNNSDYRANLVQFLAQRNAPGAALEVGIESLSQLKANGRLRTLVESIAARDCSAFEVGWRPGPVLVNKIKVWPVPQLEALRQALRKIELCRGD